MTSTPRKKIEKLNYKAGTDILEAYKSKYKQSICLVNSELTDVDVKLLDNIEQQAKDEQIKTSTVKESNEYDEVEKGSNGGVLKSFKDSIKSKMRRVIEEKRALLEADNNEEIELNVIENFSPEAKTSSNDNTNDNEGENNEESNAKSGSKKLSKLKKIHFV
jgi:hypothetical protein